MKLRVLQENFAKALSISSRFSSTKAQLPVLSNVLLRAKNNKLAISATNLETSVSLSIGAKVEEEGVITVPSKTITDVVSNLRPDQVSLESHKERLKILASSFKSAVSGMNSSDFPVVPNSVGKNAMNIPAEAFSSALSKVLFAVSVDETRPVLTGVLLIIKDASIVLVSTDGFRLSQKRIPLKLKKKLEEQRMILPKNILGELSRIKGDKETIKFDYKVKENQVVFGVDSSVLSSRIIEGEFPDFERIVPKKADIIVNVDKEELLQAVKLASVFARDSANVVRVIIKKDVFEISAESSQSGSQETKIDAKVEGDNLKKFTTAFNFRFLEEFLSVVEGDDVRMEFSESNSPAVFADPKDTNFLHIIMPVKTQV
jgi:DNA polymerase-3 subunit beta